MTILSNIRTNQLSAEGTEWLSQLLHVLDAKDLPRYITFFRPDATIMVNNGTPTMKGTDVIQQGLGGFWQTFGSLEHEELNVYGTDKRFVHEALNHFTTLDGRKVTTRAVAFIDRDEEGRIEELRLYGDRSPVFEKGN